MKSFTAIYKLLRYHSDMIPRAKTPKKKDFKEVAKKQLKKTMPILESLRDYDAGKKNISTRTAQKRLPNIRVASY